MELKLKGKTALITGGSKGIGLAIKNALEKEGVKCISWSRSEGVDLSQGTHIMPEIDFLINNVGGGGTWKKESEIMLMNYINMVDLIKQFLNKKEQQGRVITIS